MHECKFKHIYVITQELFNLLSGITCRNVGVYIHIYTSTYTGY